MLVSPKWEEAVEWDDEVDKEGDLKEGNAKFIFRYDDDASTSNNKKSFIIKLDSQRGQNSFQMFNSIMIILNYLLLCEVFYYLKIFNEEI
jgi:hypothetical protein